MHVNRFGVALQVALQALLALGMAVGTTLLLQGAGMVAMLTALLVLLTLFFFVALAFIRALPFRRYRPYRYPRRYNRGELRFPFPRQPPPTPPFGGGGPGGGFGGVREPRRPFPPGMPPRAVAADPEPTEQ